MNNIDLIIMGAGPAGYTAALTAAKAGARVRLVEAHAVGGVCLHSGCIPTKTLLESANLFQKMKKASYFGIKTGELAIDFGRMQQRKQIVVSKLERALGEEIKAHGSGGKGQGGSIDVVYESISLSEAMKQASKVIIATGTVPKVLPETISTTEALNLSTVPAHVHLVGAGVVGLELATLFRLLGSEVTVSELADQILTATVDREIANELQRYLERMGIKFSLGLRNTIDQDMDPDSKTPRPQDSKTISCVGRQFNNDGFAEAGLKLGAKGEVVVDEFGQTNLPRVYAAGDITGTWQLAHTAYAQGRAVALNALGGQVTVDYSAVPMCVFTSPPLASVGKIAGAKTLRVSYSELGAAQAKGDTDGFLRLVLAEDGEHIEGIQILGQGAAELIAAATLLVQRRATLADLKSTIWAHPTLGELFSC